MQLSPNLPPTERVEPGSIDSEPPSPDDPARLARAAAESFDFVWRLLRRLGVRPDAAVDDAVQRVFEITARKADRVPKGLERAFLFKTAMFVAAEERRRQRRTRERAAEEDPPDLASLSPDPETALDERRKRELLDEILDSIPEKFRTVFVLFELEDLTCAEIGLLLGVPEGTAASRLRLARKHFQEAARRVRARLSWRNP